MIYILCHSCDTITAVKVAQCRFCCEKFGFTMFTSLSVGRLFRLTLLNGGEIAVWPKKYKKLF